MTDDRTPSDPTPETSNTLPKPHLTSEETKAVEQATPEGDGTATAAAPTEAPRADAAPSPAPAEQSDSRQSLADLGDVVGEVGSDEPERAPMPLREQQLDKQGRAYATGRRKDAVARVWVKPGSGQILVNGRDQATYFARPTLRLVINQVFDITNRRGQYDVVATVKGGGLSGQAGAVKHGISQALTRYEPSLRGEVKAAGFLTRDSRVVERKKYGKAKARKSFQFSKR